MTPEQIKALIQNHLDAEAELDAQKAASFYTRDGEYFLAPLGLHFKGRDAVAMQYGNSYVSFPDLETTVEGERIGTSSYAHWGMLKGTLTGTFAGFPATGKSMNVYLIALYDIVDGQIARETVHFDLEEFCSQLGLDVDAVRGAARSTSAALSRSPA